MKQTKAEKSVVPTGFAKCKSQGNHRWEERGGASVESEGETLDEMWVTFTCLDCGATARGNVEWDNESSESYFDDDEDETDSDDSDEEY